VEWHEVFRGVVEVPDEVLEEEAQERRGLFGRLRRNLGKARGAVSDALKSAVYVGVDRRLYEQTEEMLIAADVGVDGTIKIIDELEQRCTEKKIETREPFQNELADVVAELLRPADPELQRIDVTHQPTVILMVGVNGTGKTTTIGKIAWRLKEMGKTPLMVAGDTFRAAAVEQLSEWASRVGCEIVKQAADADPAAVVFDGVAAARSRGADVVLVDTAGRLHTQVNLMRELEKVRRVIEKQLPGAPHETLLVLDATTGQNGLRQAQEFKQAVDISGVVLTKLDGTAKGGIVVAIHETLGIPIKLIGVGEQLEDLRPFEPDIFARAIFGSADGYEAASDTPAGDVAE
jgi:fused signal recognition particle receptor